MGGFTFRYHTFPTLRLLWLSGTFIDLLHGLYEFFYFLRNIIESRIILDDFFYTVDKKADTFTHILRLAKNNVMIFFIIFAVKE